MLIREGLRGGICCTSYLAIQAQMGLHRRGMMQTPTLTDQIPSQIDDCCVTIPETEYWKYEVRTSPPVVRLLLQFHLWW
jgi:hypothetical protein